MRAKMLVTTSLALGERWEYFIAIKSHNPEEYGDIII